MLSAAVPSLLGNPLATPWNFNTLFNFLQGNRCLCPCNRFGGGRNGELPEMEDLLPSLDF